MNTCSYTIHFKKISSCSKVLVECMIYFGELNKTSSSSSPSSSEPLIRFATFNTKKLKRSLFFAMYACKCVHHMLSKRKDWDTRPQVCQEKLSKKPKPILLQGVT